MLNFFVGYFDPTGVATQRVFQSDGGREHHRSAAVDIIRRLYAEGCTPGLITRIPGDYSLKELEQLCENGLPQSLSPLHGTYEYLDGNGR